MDSYQIRDVLELLIYSGTFLASLFMVTRVWMSRRAQVKSGDLVQLIDAVERLRESVDGVRLDMGDLTERIDFTERVLAQMAEDKRIEPRRLPNQ